MRSLTFNPGPSKISGETYADVEKALATGFLEVSHRSSTFYDVSSECIENLKAYLNVPEEYHVIFLDSATSAWHSVVANTVHTKSFHLVNGAFSEKAESAARKLYKETDSSTVPPGEVHIIADISVPDNAELITCCYNESSAGTTMTPADIKTLQSRFPEPLLAVDATSCAAALQLPIESADLWYFSVQKGFGLPSGLGVLIISPRAYERSLLLAKRGENLAGIWQWSEYVGAQTKQPGQTIQTPNMLGIFLLNEQLKRYQLRGGIDTIELETKKKAERISALIDTGPNLSHFVREPAHRSPTVIAIQAHEDYIAALHNEARAQDIVLGTGYGELKSTTFRIANFPAITDADIDRLEQVFNTVSA